jgi:hypothetical protein
MCMCMCTRLRQAQRPEAHHGVARRRPAAALADRVRTVQKPHPSHLYMYVCMYDKHIIHIYIYIYGMHVAGGEGGGEGGSIVREGVPTRYLQKNKRRGASHSFPPTDAAAGDSTGAESRWRTFQREHRSHGQVSVDSDSVRT